MAPPPLLSSSATTARPIATLYPVPHGPELLRANGMAQIMSEVEGQRGRDQWEQHVVDGRRPLGSGRWGRRWFMPSEIVDPVGTWGSEARELVASMTSSTRRWSVWGGGVAKEQR